MKMKFHHETKGAYRIEVELSADLDKYARDFLAIFNNVRNHEELYKVENLEGTCRVFVTCASHVKPETVRFLEQFGEVKDIEHVLYAEAQLDWDYDLPEEYDSLVVGAVGGE